MEILNGLEIQTIGEIGLLRDYSQDLIEVKKYCEGLEIKDIKTYEEYKESFKVSKIIETAQNKIKDVMKKLDNEEIQNIKENLLEINKVLAGKKTQGKKIIDKWKLSYKDFVIETAYSNIISQINFQADYESFKQDCLESFKGKSDFGVMQELANTMADNYSNRLERDQLKYDKNFLELKAFCQEIGLAENDYTLELESKNVVKGKDIEEIKTMLKDKLELQNKKVIEKAEELRLAEELKKQEIVKEKLVEIPKEIPKEIKEDIKIETKEESKTIVFALQFTTTIEKANLLKQFLDDNKIEYIKN